MHPNCHATRAHTHIVRSQLQHRQGVKSSNVASTEDWLPPVDDQCSMVNSIAYSTEKSCIIYSVE